ncbi:MAG TPA: cytochrome c3 family protein [Acidobacteriota bacterium]|nr:cytochrome c3 family protein [Acidobacteriota bacterium]
MLRRFKRFSYLVNYPVFLLVLLSACALSFSAQSQPTGVDAICLKCHTSVAATLQKQFKHKTLEKGCLSCHMDCREITPTSNRHNVPANYLKAAEPDVCFECHPMKDIAPAHKNQIFAQAKCSSCHEPHASNSPKRLPDVLHGPFAKRDCAACHAAPVDGRVQLVAPNVEALCFSCHEDIKLRIANSKYKHDVVSSDKALVRTQSSCLECHDAHATNQKYFLKQPELSLCRDCHVNLTAGKSFVHEPVAISCTFCHDAHASDIPQHLYVPVQDLCLGCHAQDAIKIQYSKKPYPLFGGKTNLPPNTFKKVQTLGRTGHPTAKHPVYAPATAKTPELNCLSCHTPHAAATDSNLLVNDSRSLCMQCHKEMVLP